jgi:hypothetical protein
MAMTPQRYFSITIPGEPTSHRGDSWQTLQRLRDAGIKISVTTLYKIKANYSRTFPGNIKVTGIR